MASHREHSKALTGGRTSSMFVVLRCMTSSCGSSCTGSQHPWQMMVSEDFPVPSRRFSSVVIVNPQRRRRVDNEEVHIDATRSIFAQLVIHCTQPPLQSSGYPSKRTGTPVTYLG